MQNNTDSQSTDLLFITVQMLEEAKLCDLPRRFSDLAVYLGRPVELNDGLTFREWSELLRADDEHTYSATVSDLALVMWYFDQSSFPVAMARILNACFGEVEKGGDKVDPRSRAIAIALEHEEIITTLMAIAAAEARDESWGPSLGYTMWMAADIAASVAGGTVAEVIRATDRAKSLLGNARVRKLLLG